MGPYTRPRPNRHSDRPQKTVARHTALRSFRHYQNDIGSEDILVAGHEGQGLHRMFNIR